MNRKKQKFVKLEPKLSIAQDIHDELEKIAEKLMDMSDNYIFYSPGERRDTIKYIIKQLAKDYLV